MNVTVGIDASNLSPSGLNPGTRTHLVEMLAAAEPEAHGVSGVVVWSNPGLLDSLPNRSWLKTRTAEALSGGLAQRTWWQRSAMASAGKEAGCDILLIPGGHFVGKFRPVVTMSQNLLPFEKQEYKRYGLSAWWLKTMLIKKLQTRSFQRAEGVIFLTDYARRTVEGVTGSLSGATTTIPHGVNERFRMEPKKQQAITHYNTAKPFRLIYVSTVDHYKHQWNVVRAIDLLRQRTGWPIHIDFVGPSYAHAMSRFRQSLDLADTQGSWAHYHGAIPYTELHRAYSEADMAVFASSCENMPNILLEKMIAGLPLACSDRGPMPEVLRDGGEYFDPEDPESIAAAVGSLISSCGRRQTLADKAYHSALRYSWTVCAGNTFAFLRDVFARHQGKPQG